MQLCVVFTPVLQNTVFHHVRIEKILEVNPRIRRIFLRYPLEITYKSGQFIIIDFGELDHKYSTRSYSIADYTQGSLIEICIVLKDDGAATPLLFQMQVGESLLASDPQGRFTLPEEIDCPMFGFICTGTGVAPFRAMIKDLLIHRNYTGRVHLYFGCRTKDEILYREEFEMLQMEHLNFSYTPVLSREKWEAATGYVHAHYPAVFANRPEGLIYLCGWTEMLRETRDKLKSYGYTRNEIRIEYYD